MKKWIMAIIVILSFFSIVFAIVFPQDDNGVPYNYPVLVGGSPPGTFTDVRLFDNAGTPFSSTNTLWSSINNIWFSGKPWLANTVGSFSLPSVFLSDASGNAIGSVTAGGPPVTSLFVALKYSDGANVGYNPYAGANAMNVYQVDGYAKIKSAADNVYTGTSIGAYELMDVGLRSPISGLPYRSTDIGATGVSEVLRTAGLVYNSNTGSWEDAPAQLQWYDGTAGAMRRNLMAYPLPISLREYPSTAIPLFENSTTNSLYVNVNETYSTLTTEVTTNGSGAYSNTILTPASGKKIAVKSIQWATSATSSGGTIVLNFNTSSKIIEKGYLTSNTKNNSVDMNIEGAINEPITLTIASGGNAQAYFVVVNYREK